MRLGLCSDFGEAKSTPSPAHALHSGSSSLAIEDESKLLTLEFFQKTYNTSMRLGLCSDFGEAKSTPSPAQASGSNSVAIGDQSKLLTLKFFQKTYNAQTLGRPDPHPVQRSVISESWPRRPCPHRNDEKFLKCAER